MICTMTIPNIAPKCVSENVTIARSKTIKVNFKISKTYSMLFIAQEVSNIFPYISYNFGSRCIGPLRGNALAIPVLPLALQEPQMVRHVTCDILIF